MYSPFRTGLALHRDIPALKNSITLFIIWSRFLLVLLDAFCFQMGGICAWWCTVPADLQTNLSVHIKSAAAAICLEMVKVQFHIKLMCTVFCPKSFRRVRALSASVISEALVVCFFLFFLISPGLIFPSVTI